MAGGEHSSVQHNKQKHKCCIWLDCRNSPLTLIILDKPFPCLSHFLDTSFYVYLPFYFIDRFSSFISYPPLSLLLSPRHSCWFSCIRYEQYHHSLQICTHQLLSFKVTWISCRESVMVVAGFLLQPSKQFTNQAFIFYKPESSDGIMADTKPARFRVLCTKGSSCGWGFQANFYCKKRDFPIEQWCMCFTAIVLHRRSLWKSKCPHWHICSFHLLFTRFASMWLYLCPDNQHKRLLWHTAGSPIWIRQAHEHRDLKPAAMSFWLEVCNM